MALPEELSIKEKETVNELKSRIYNDVPLHLRDDIFLYLRFLRARDFNIDMAEDMLRNHLTWRKANQIETILKDFVPSEVVLEKDTNFSVMTPAEKRNARMGVVAKYIPLSRIGFDKDGSPIRYFAFGDMDAKGILKSAKKNECVKAVIQCFEDDVKVMKEQTQKLGKPIEQWTYIFNFGNYTFAKATHKPTLEILVALFMAYEANYPERLKACYIINASVYFNILFSVVKPLLSGATIKKITIYGKDGWKDEVLKTITPDVLPAFLGGQKKDSNGDPMCRSFVKHGELVPPEFYLSRTAKKRLSTQPGVQKVTVARMSKVNLDLKVSEAGSLIEWEFETEGRDIGFGLLYREPDQATRELVPKQRIDTQMVSEVGMYQCDMPGTYVLVFDNSYSWIHQKEIYYKATVVNAKN